MQVDILNVLYQQCSHQTIRSWQSTNSSITARFGVEWKFNSYLFVQQCHVQVQHLPMMQNVTTLLRLLD